MKKIITTCLVALFLVFSMFAAGEKDIVKTNAGDLEITCIGHASLMFTFNGMVIYVDPFSMTADYSKLPKADLILITHQHSDHMDQQAIDKIKKEDTIFILTKKCSETMKGIVMNNGDVKEIKKLKIEAVPAYNIVQMRTGGMPFHPKGEGNGYIITFGDKRVYVAGDTENTPEMKALKDIDIAFLPVNMPYTMDEDMVLDAIKAFKPKILYPYHFQFGTSRLPQLEEKMKDIADIELRVRNRK